MKIKTQHPRLSGCAIALVLGLSTLTAQAGDVVANASRNLDGLVTHPSPGSSTSAYWPNPTLPDAYAVVTRTSIERVTNGAGSATNNAAAASGTSWTAYTLWDLGSNAALDGATAATLDLNFNYRIQGQTRVEQVSTSVASSTYLVELYSGAYHGDGAGLTVVFGPVPPFPSENYIFNGDMRLYDNYDWNFSVLHENAGTGFMWMSFSASAAFMSSTTGTLSLQTITLADGVMPAGGLGVKLETGELIPVSAVPEPASWLLWLAAGAWALGRRQLRAD